MLTQQQQLLLTTDKTTTTTTKDKLIIVPITSFTTTLTENSIITPNGNGKNIAIGNLVKTRIKRLTAIAIKTTLNIIIANIVFAKLVHDLK